MKVLAATSLSAIFVENITEYSQEFCYLFLTGILEDREIQFQAKNYLNRAVMYSLEQCDQQYLDQWKIFTKQLLEKQTLQQSQTHNNTNSNGQNMPIYSSIQVGLFLLTSFTCAEINDNIVLQLPQTDIMENVMAQIKNRIGQQNSKNSKQREKLLLYMTQAWKIVVEYLVFNMIGDTKQKYFIKMAKNQDLKQIIEYSYKTLSTGGGKHFLYLDSQNLQIQPILQIKTSLSEIHYMVLSVIFEFNRQNARQTALYEFTGLNMQYIINSLCFTGFHPQIRQDFDIDQNLIVMVKILKLLIEDSPQILSSSWRQLLHFLVFSLLKIQNEELIDFQQNTNGYVELSQDICEKQRLGTLKTQTAKLLQIISDQSMNIIPKSSNPSTFIHSSSTSQPPLLKNQAIITKYIINFAISSIKHHLQMQFMNVNSNNFQNYSLSFNCPDNVSIMDVETAFLVLTIFSFALEYYKKEIQEIRIILCSERIGKMPPLERARIYTFLAYNYDELFSINSSSSLQTLNHWVSLAFLEQTHPTVSYCAMDFITNSLHKLYNQKTIISIIQKIPTTKCINFWPLVKKMIQLFATKMSQEILTSFVQAVYRRIQIQIQNQIGNNMKVTYVISTLLHSIRVISQKGQFISTMPDLKSKLWQITNLYHVAIANNFQDEMIKIINCFLYFASKQEVQHRNMTQFLPQFINQFVNVQFEPTYYYIAFNHFIEKGNFNQCVLPIFSVLRNSLEYFFNQEIKDQVQAHRKRIPIAHTLLLFENIVAWHGAELPEQYLIYLHQKLKCLYPKRTPSIKPSSSNPTQTTIKQKLRIYDRSLLSRALLIQFLCSMYQPTLFIPTLTNLIKYHDLKIFYGYDATVLVSCIKLQIFKETNLQNLIELLMIVVRVVYGWSEMEVEVKKDEVREVQRKIQKGEYQEEYKIDQEQNQDRNAKKSAMILRIKKTSDYQLILAYIHTPFKSNQPHPIGFARPSRPLEQIRQQLSQLLLQLRTSNQALFESIMMGLSQDMRYKLEAVIETKMQSILQGQITIDRSSIKNKNKNNDLKDRKIFKVKKAKMGYIDQGKIYYDGVQLQDDANKRQMVRLGEEDKEDDSDSQVLKSHKAEKKKKQKFMSIVNG